MATGRRVGACFLEPVTQLWHGRKLMTSDSRNEEAPENLANEPCVDITFVGDRFLRNQCSRNSPHPALWQKYPGRPEHINEIVGPENSAIHCGESRVES